MKRLRFTEAQIIGILKEANSGASTVRNVCRKDGATGVIVQIERLWH